MFSLKQNSEQCGQCSSVGFAASPYTGSTHPKQGEWHHPAPSPGTALTALFLDSAKQLFRVVALIYTAISSV